MKTASGLYFCRCICWSVAEDPSISVDNLYKRAYDQWLLADLKEVGIPCLPNTLFVERKDAFELKGHYVLQMNYVLDICKIGAFAVA